MAPKSAPRSLFRLTFSIFLVYYMAGKPVLCCGGRRFLASVGQVPSNFPDNPFRINTYRNARKC